MTAGARSELAPAVARYVAAEGPGGRHLVLGTTDRLTADKAALANATLGHALDYDDVVSAMPGHPSAILVPVLLAQAEVAPLSGADFLTAYLVGFEVATKMGMAMGSGHYRRGWHSTGTLGIFGACAAAARAYGLQPLAIVHALGIATSMAASLRVNFGTMTKPLHSGWAASAGLTAARLAAAGFTSSQTALSANDGFFSVYGGDPEHARVVLAGLGAPFTMEAPGMSLKKYPCCYALHRAIDALQGLHADGLLSDVRTITAAVPPGSLLPVPYQRPDTGFEARFSMNYILAVGMVDPDFGFPAFTDEAVRRTSVLEALERTRAIEDPACSPGDPEGRLASAGTRGFVEVRVEHEDGRQTVRRVEVPPGSPGRPLSWDEVTAKFADCAAFGGLDAGSGKRALELIRRLDTLDDVGELWSCLAGERFAGRADDGEWSAAHVASGDEV
jgi:2-methylcitrate dehydratase PrpD